MAAQSIITNDHTKGKENFILTIERYKLKSKSLLNVKLLSTVSLRCFVPVDSKGVAEINTNTDLVRSKPVVSTLAREFQRHHLETPEKSKSARRKGRIHKLSSLADNGQSLSLMASSSQTNYNAINTLQNGQPPGSGDEENAPLFETNGSKESLFQKLYNYMTNDIDTKHGDIILLICYTITGLLDSSSISIWGSFVSMQTGNTVYLGLGLTDPYGGTRWIKAATSLSCFCLGSFVFARYHRFFSPRRRWVFVLSHFLGMLMIIVAALIVMLESEDSNQNPLRWQVLIPIALMAFQAAAQAVTSRALKFNALTSVVLTSIYCDLFSDANLFAGLTSNIERNQRAIAPIALLIGVLGGGFWAKSSFGMAGSLWSAVALKAGIVLAWLLWKPAK